MIRDFERYHGVVLRRLVVEAPRALVIKQSDIYGRINAYAINNGVFIYIKHCSKRLPPWQFNVTSEQVSEIRGLTEDPKYVWLALVCGIDGVVCLSYEEFINLAVLGRAGTATIRVDRSPRHRYRVSGKDFDIYHVKASGVSEVLNFAFEMEPTLC
jgi:hypothetical protein